MFFAAHSVGIPGPHSQVCSAILRFYAMAIAAVCDPGLGNRGGRELYSFDRPTAPNKFASATIAVKRSARAPVGRDSRGAVDDC